MAMSSDWLAGSVLSDLPQGWESSVEVKMAVDGTALAEKLRLAKDGGEASPSYLIAGKPYKRGELIAAELAIVFAKGTLFDGEGLPLEDCKFIGPFATEKGKAPALRACAQMPACKAILKDNPTRGKLFASALKGHGFPCKVPLAWLSASKPTTSEAEDRSASQGRALFMRSSLLSHSCHPNAVATVLFDKNVPGPAIFVIATKPIAEGERITVSLLPDLAAPRKHRHTQLNERYSYKESPSSPSSPCVCSRCSAAFDDTEGVICEGTSEGGSACKGAQRRHKKDDAGNDEDGSSSYQSSCSDCSHQGSKDAWEKRESLLSALDHAIHQTMRVGSTESPSSTSPEALLAAVENKDHIRAATAATHLAHPSDTAVLSRLHRLVHALVRPGVLLGKVVEKKGEDGGTSSGSSTPAPAPPGLAASPEDLKDCVTVSQWVVDAAASLPYLDPFLLLEIVTDHALLCGMANDTERGTKAWAMAAELSSTFNPLGTPLSEMYAAFARKPPRDVKEASVAYRMRAMAEKALGL
jgi:hypothetical protein